MALSFDRSVSEPCRFRDCAHGPADHLETPELASGPEELVRFCTACRRHEVIAERWWSSLFGRRADVVR